MNQQFLAQWNEQHSREISERDRKLGPGEFGWQQGGVIPNEIAQQIKDGKLAPLMVKLRPGDIVLGHYLLVHEVAPNYEDEIRMQLYWRVKDQGFDNTQSLLEIWRDYR
jgi:hypothetical protein